MSALARFAVRHWVPVLLFWVVAAGLVTTLTPPFADVATYDDSAFLPEGATSVRGQELIEEGWPEDNFTRVAVLALVRDDGPLSGRDEAYAAEVVRWLRSEAAPEAFGAVVTHLEDDPLTDALTSDDGQAMIVMAGLDVTPFSPPAAVAVHGLRERLRVEPPPPGLAAHVTGAAALAVDEDEAIEESVSRTQFLTIGLVVGLLLWVLRSPVAALIPLVTVMIAYTVALNVVALLADAGMAVSYLFQTFSLVIIFGAGTDYALLMMSRFREELGGDTGLRMDREFRHRKLLVTMGVLGGVLASSAGSTIVGFSAQSVAEFGLFRTMGPALATAVAVTLVAGLTLSPALMRAVGRLLFWPHGGRHPEPGRAESQV